MGSEETVLERAEMPLTNEELESLEWAFRRGSLGQFRMCGEYRAVSLTQILLAQFRKYRAAEQIRARQAE
jgi:hypothetical protein